MSKLLGFKALQQCPKCLTARQFADVKWGHWGSHPGDVAEGLRVECNNCGFVWFEECADAQAKTSDEFRR